MKILIGLFLLFSLIEAYAEDCKVYGISDSPQKLECQFEDFKVFLSCKNGSYFLNSTRVALAFHMDVEEGASPLVFKAVNMQLTATKDASWTGELERNGKTFSGPCQ